MPASHQNKKKQRFAKRTILVFGEGLGEEVFLKYLKSLYAHGTGVRVKVVRGKGGSADGIVLDASRVFGTFDKRIAVLDCDKGEDEMERARLAADAHGIVLLEHSPCLETVLLAILDSKNIPENRKSEWYKNEFESKYIKESRRGELREYEKLFPKLFLDRKRSTVSELDKIIRIFEGR